MQFDFKVTTWERVVVAKEHEATILEAIKRGEITCQEDIWNNYDVDPESEFLDIASEQITPSENGGYATIEAVNDEGETIYDNSIRINE